MKIPLKKVIFLLSIFFISLTIYLSYNYLIHIICRYIVKGIEEYIGRPASIRGMSIGFPPHLEIRDLKIKDDIGIKKIDIYFQPGAIFLKNRFTFSYIKIINPYIRIEKGDTFPLAFLSEMRHPLSHLLYFSKVMVEDGTLLYILNDITEFQFIRINGVLETTNPYFTKDKPYIFEMKGLLKNKNSSTLSPVEIEGWMAQDHLFRLKIMIKKINIESLGDLYVKYLKEIITEGKVDFFSNVYIWNNILRAECTLTYHNLMFSKPAIFKVDKPLNLNFILFIDFVKHSLRVTNLHGDFLTRVMGIF